MTAKNLRLGLAFLLFAFIAGFSNHLFAGITTKPERNTINKSQITIVGEALETKTLNKLPRKAERLTFNEKQYHYFGGYYYELNKELFTRVKAPIGIRVKSISDTYQRIIISGRVYYYTCGVFYVADGKKAFQTVYGPIGGQVSALPEGIQKVQIKGRNYFMYYDLVFKKSESRSRKYFEVFGYVAE